MHELSSTFRIIQFNIWFLSIYCFYLHNERKKEISIFRQSVPKSQVHGLFENSMISKEYFTNDMKQSVNRYCMIYASALENRLF